MTYSPYKESWAALFELDLETMRTAILADLEQDFESGNNSALLDAVEICLNTGTKAPDWVYIGFNIAWALRWESGHARTLGDAFGIERPENWRQRSERKKALSLSGLIFQRIEKYRRDYPGESNKRDLFETVASEWNDEIKSEPEDSVWYGLKLRWKHVENAYKAIWGDEKL